MRIWLISQDENNDYDTYDSAVVAAESEEEAKKIHPSGHIFGDGEKFGWGHRYSGWCSEPGAVTAKPIGIADESVEANSVILASFNAG